MINREVNRHSKRAFTVVEVAIGVALALAVVFVALGLWGNNLSTMMDNSRISHMWDNNKDKTAYNSYDRDYSQSQISVQTFAPSQVPVQITGDQGLITLDDFIKKAETNVDYYDKNPPKTEAQLEDLAKCLTILNMTGGAVAMANHDGHALATAHGITIVISPGEYVTQVQNDNTSGLVINKQFEYNADSNPLSLPDDKLTAAKDIRDATYTQTSQ